MTKALRNGRKHPRTIRADPDPPEKGIGPITLGMRAGVLQLCKWSQDKSLTPYQRNIAWRAAVQFPEFPQSRGGYKSKPVAEATRGNCIRSEFLARLTSDPSCLLTLDALIY